MTPRWLPIAAAAALAVGPLQSLLAQDPPAWSHLSLGEIREVWVWQDPMDSGHQWIWTAEDGGRIRHGERQGGVTTWQQQATPDEVRGPLHDVYFLDDVETGFACGADGMFIATTDGETWDLRGDQVLDGNWEPALLWGTHFFDEDFGLLAGNKVLRYTTDGGETWDNVTVDDGSGSHYQLVEYYSFDFIEDAQGQPLHGVVTADPAAILYTQDGMLWTLADVPAGLPEGLELWDVCFEPDPADPDHAFGVCVGGEEGKTWILVTNDSGQTWEEETFTGATDVAYGVFVWSDADAVLCGYGGLVGRRTSSGWSEIAPGGGPQPCLPNGRFTGPLLGVDGTADGRFWIGGSFGYLRRSDDGNLPLTQDTPQASRLFRVRATAWRGDDVDHGYLASQSGIHRTLNGGLTWNFEVCTVGDADLQDIALNGEAGVAVGLGDPTPPGAPAAYWRDEEPNGSGSYTWKPSSNTDGESLRAVAWHSGTTWFAVGDGSTVLRSDDGGESFYAVTGPDGQPSGLPALHDIAFSGNLAVVVGTEDGQGVIYTTTNVLASTISWARTDAPDAGTGLRAVAMRGQLPNLEIVAVGAGGVALVYDRNANEYDPLGGAHQATAEDLLCVALPAGSNATFIGGEHGVILQDTGSGFLSVKSQTSKDVRGFWFLNGGFGQAACVSSVENGDPSLGSIASSCLIRFAEDP